MAVKLLTLDAGLACGHQAPVVLVASQDFVRVAGRPVLVQGDLLGRPVRGCAMATPTTPPCTLTVGVDDAPSHSRFVRIAGRPVCLGSASGQTNWGNLMTTPWTTQHAGQDFVSIEG